MPKETKQIISALKEPKVHTYLLKKGIKSLFLVWSYSTGKQTTKSDIDLIYEKKDPKNFDFFDRMDVQNYLAKYLKRQVDMISPMFLDPYIKKSLMKTKIQVF